LSARCILPAGATLGEGPAWDARDGALLFVDIKDKRLHRLFLTDGAHQTWGFDEPICWIIPRAHAPGYIAGFKSGFKALTLEPFNLAHLGEPEPDRPGNRLNDAKADRWGRIWAGSMDDAEQQTSGALYRLDADLSWRRMDDGYGVANGPTFSPGGATLYHADSARRLVYAFKLDTSGALMEKRVFVRFEEAWGYPDGMTTDAEGGVWIAHWDGARISRFTPDGALDRAIALPVSRPTSCAFAGEALDRMFVTTASTGCENETLAGALFEVDPGVCGAPVYSFAG
jgi:sugar lactone lactonase YvrE